MRWRDKPPGSIDSSLNVPTEILDNGKQTANLRSNATQKRDPGVV